MTLARILAAYLNASVFEVLDRDISEIYMIVDFYIDYGSLQSANANQITNTNSKETRIRVNDKTATGGWF